MNRPITKWPSVAVEFAFPAHATLRKPRSFGWLLVAVLLLGCGQDDGRDEAVATLSGDGEGFRQAAPGMGVQLPDDLGAHRRFRLEWWYLTANLQAADGSAFGVQWTLFRIGLRPGPYDGRPPGWRRDEVWLAHAALSQPGEHRFDARWARGGSGQAGAQSTPFRAWLDDWELAQQPDGGWALSTRARDFAYALKLQPLLPVVLHGDDGFSAKSAGGGGSMYFSYPSLAINGSVEVEGRRLAVTGQGWFDREWSSQYLLPDQQGWDWLSLHLDDGRHLMLFRIRGDETYHTGTLIEADGRYRTLQASDYRLTPQEFRDSRFGRVPVGWRLEMPAAGLDLVITSWSGDYWNAGRLRYWEGPVVVSGSQDGEGYLEMTGYGDSGNDDR
ncbi:MAG: carotenoid 1,2-hydratase [Oceanospirillaceae bacterium]|nr:carotenoid 1,2-hydratase [Oceanospirillaceae bacterium]